MKQLLFEKQMTRMQSALWSAGIIGLLYLVNFSFFYPVYESNDDITFQLYASGFYTGEPEFRLIFTNSVFGFLLNGLYTLSEQINWYTLFILVFQFLAFWNLLYQAGKKDQGVFYWLIVLFLIVFPAWYITLKINFTTTAALLSLSGFLSLINAKTRKEYVIAWLLYFLGIMLRYESVILTHMLFVPFALLHHGWKNIPVLLRRFSVPAMLFAGLFLIQALSYRDSAWQQLFKLNQEKALLDQPVSRKLTELDVAPLKAAGWSKNDVDLFRNFVFEDPETMQPDKIKALSGLLPAKSYNPLQSWREILHGTIQWLQLLHPLFLLLLIEGLLLVAWINRMQTALILALFIGVTAFFAWLYLPRTRGMVSIELAALSLIASLIVSGKGSPKKLQWMRLLVFSLTGSLILVQMFQRNIETGFPLRQQAEAKFNYLQTHTNFTHVIVSTSMQFEGLHPLKQYWQRSNQDIKFIWAANMGGTPHQTKAMKRLQTENVYQLLLRDDTRLIGSYDFEPRLFQTYFQERLEREVPFETIKDDPGFYVWKFNN
jgi:hypothetical protein